MTQGGSNYEKWLFGAKVPLLRPLGIVGFTDVPSVSVSAEKGSNRTRSSKESSVNEDELDGRAGIGNDFLT